MERDSVFLSYYTEAQPARMQSKPVHHARPMQTHQSRSINAAGPTQPQRVAQAPIRQPVQQPAMRQALPPRNASHAPQQQPAGMRQQQQQGIYQPPMRQVMPQQTHQHQVPRPTLQVNVPRTTSPPRAAFSGPLPSPTPSSAETLVASPAHSPNMLKKEFLLSPQAPASNISVSKASSIDADRFGAAPGGQVDFWKRFSMVIKDVEEEKKQNKKTGNDWLSQNLRKSAGMRRWIWLVTILILAGIGGGLAWHFTHPSSNANSQPSQHDFGLGSGSSSANPLATQSVNAGISKRTQVARRGGEAHRARLRARHTAAS